MKRVTAVFLAAAFMLAVCPVTASFCQEDEADYAYGVVIETSGNTVTIEEVAYDDQTGEEITKKEVYEISPEAELENVASAGDIRAKDELDIEYVEKDGKKVATYIYRYTAEEQE